MAGKNWYESLVEHHDYICISCAKERATARSREIGHKPMQNKYGIPRNLPDGSRNLEYDEAWRRAHGRKPRSLDWGKKYGVPSLLPNGRPNPEYATNRRRAKGMKPIETWYNRGSKYGVPSHLKNGKRNPEWYKRYYKSPDGKTSVNKSGSKRRFLYPLKIILGNPFKGSHLHHVTKEVGVYIPQKLHQSIPHCLSTGKNMDKINVLAMEFYERGGKI